MRWLGYGPEHDEWVHEEELRRWSLGITEAILDYVMGYSDVVVRVM